MPLARMCTWCGMVALLSTAAQSHFSLPPPPPPPPPLPSLPLPSLSSRVIDSSLKSIAAFSSWVYKGGTPHNQPTQFCS